MQNHVFTDAVIYETIRRENNAHLPLTKLLGEVFECMPRNRVSKVYLLEIDGELVNSLNLISFPKQDKLHHGSKYEIKTVPSNTSVTSKWDFRCNSDLCEILKLFQ